MNQFPPTAANVSRHAGARGGRTIAAHAPAFAGTLVAALAAALAAAPAAARMVYAAPLHEAHWQAAAHADRCTLEHTIPGYGSARFERRADGLLVFTLSAHHAPAGPGYAVLSALDPAWRHPRASHEVTRVLLSGEATPVRLQEQQALRLLLQLERGREPAFRYRDENAAGDLIEVRLSTVTFAAGLAQFRTCAEQLRSPAERAPLRVRFAPDSAVLDAEMRRRLDGVAAAVARDRAIARILLVGHADALGNTRYNLKLSQRRALAVLDYLAGKGIREELFELIALGETERTPQNTPRVTRSVTLQLLR